VFLLTGAGYPNTTSFSEDDPQFCQQSNQMAYDWALGNAATPTLARFKQYEYHPPCDTPSTTTP
jgi:hypothetical protein